MIVLNKLSSLCSSRPCFASLQVQYKSKTVINKKIGERRLLKYVAVSIQFFIGVFKLKPNLYKNNPIETAVHNIAILIAASAL
nr:hypothetical protein [Ningiella sp. W23]